MAHFGHLRRRTPDKQDLQLHQRAASLQREAKGRASFRRWYRGGTRVVDVRLEDPRARTTYTWKAITGDLLTPIRNYTMPSWWTTS